MTTKTTPRPTVLETPPGKCGADSVAAKTTSARRDAPVDTTGGLAAHSPADAPVGMDSTTSASAGRSDLLEDVAAALAGLAAVERIPLELTYLRGLSTAQVAARLQVSRSEVGRRLARGLLTFRVTFDRLSADRLSADRLSADRS